MAESYGSLRVQPAVERFNCFLQWLTTLHSHQQYMRAPFSLQPWKPLSRSVFLIIAILMWQGSTV
jgi:hypothetical protein